jgi:hypothetical protein
MTSSRALALNDAGILECRGWLLDLGTEMRLSTLEELPVSEDALRNWFWSSVIAFALLIWVIWDLEVGM